MVIIRAEWDTLKWSFIHTTKKDPEWHDLTEPKLQHYEELRDVLFRKYQRRRVPWRFIVELDERLARMREEAGEGEV